MKFSIIVPVYNVENYLEECIKSLLNQNYNNYEIILVDDGSKDGSGKLCDLYAKKDKKIKVFHKENGGLSDARNFGMDYADGDYLIFVDSDDWIEENILLEIADTIKNKHVDVIESRFIEMFNEKKHLCDEEFEDYVANGFDKERAIMWKLQLSHNTWPAPKCIYARSFIEKYRLRFLKGFLHEDIDWTANVIYHALEYAAFTKPFYYHRMSRDGSITTSIKAKNITDCIEIAYIHYKKYKENPNDINKMVINRIMISIYGKINQIKLCNDEDTKKVLECMKKNKCIFEVSPSIKYKLFTFGMKVFGLEKTIKLLKYIK